jgi:hypothetical protein
MTIASNKNTPRNTYTATGGQTAFTIGFEFFKVEDVKVYRNGSLLTYNASPSSVSQYKITGTASASDDAYEFGAGGTVTLGSGATADDIIVIIRDITLERTSDFPTTGAFDITTLNTQLDTMTSMLSDLKQQSDRAVKLLDTDTTSATVTLPTKATRAGKMLSFDTNGNTESTIASSGLATLAGITSDITTVAGISSNVTSVASNATNINTVAGSIANVNAVATDIAKVITVANDLNETVSEIETVATDLQEAQPEIDTVAGSIGNVDIVGNAIANVNTLAGLNTEITNLNNIRTDISGVNTISANVTSVDSNSANINTVAGDITNINQLAGALSLETTFVVTVAGGVFVIDGSNNPTLTLDRGATYIFDVSDNSVTGHPLAFKDGSGTSYTTGVTVTGTAGSSGAKVTIVVAANAPSSLRYYCTVHGNGMGNTISVVNNNLTTVASNINNVNTVGAGITNVNTVAGINANVTTVAGISSNVTTVAGIHANVTTVANDQSDIGIVATNIANVNNVGSNITGVNSFAERYRVASSDPSTSLDAGDLAFNTTGNVLKYYDGSSWQGITAGGISDLAQDSTPQLGGDLDLNSNTINGTGTINFTGNLTATNVAGAGASLTALNASNLASGTVAEARLPASALGAIWESKSANFTAEARKNYFIDTSSSAVTATLPSSGTAGDEIHFLDVNGTFDTNNLTVARNSHNIQGINQDMVVAVERAGFTLVYYNATQGWVLKDV